MYKCPKCEFANASRHSVMIHMARKGHEGEPQPYANGSTVEPARQLILLNLPPVLTKTEWATAKGIGFIGPEDGEERHAAVLVSFVPDAKNVDLVERREKTVKTWPSRPH